MFIRFENAHEQERFLERVGRERPDIASLLQPVTAPTIVIPAAATPEQKQWLAGHSGDAEIFEDIGFEPSSSG